MGLGYTYDSPCWEVRAFDSKQERDEYVDECGYNQDTGNYVAEACTRKVAEEIAPDLRMWDKDIHANNDNDRPWRVIHM